MRDKMKITLKNNKKVKLNKKCVKQLYFSLNDKSIKDFQKILDLEDKFNYGLLDYNYTDERFGNINSLLSEGVLENIPTGEDTGIYNYKEVDDLEDEPEEEEDEFEKYEIFLQKKENNKDLDNEFKYEDEEDFSPFGFYGYTKENDFGFMPFRKCMLAQSNPLGGSETAVVTTFRGYLEVMYPFGVIRKSEYDSEDELNAVYIPEYFINRYKLKNGDQIMCTCTKLENGKMVLESLLSINEILLAEWNVFRPSYNTMEYKKKHKKVRCHGEYMDIICKEFGLQTGDNVYIYLDKNTNKKEFIGQFINDLISGYDKVVYINPNFNPLRSYVDNLDIIKFCTKCNESFNIQSRIVLLGVNYAKRLVELGYNVAMVIDDINAIALLDKDFNGEMPITKTVLCCSKDTDHGSLSNYLIIPPVSECVVNVDKMFKSIENLELIMDNNELDIYNSCRIQ